MRGETRALVVAGRIKHCRGRRRRRRRHSAGTAALYGGGGGMHCACVRARWCACVGPAAAVAPFGIKYWPERVRTRPTFIYICIYIIYFIYYYIHTRTYRPAALFFQFFFPSQLFRPTYTSSIVRIMDARTRRYIFFFSHPRFPVAFNFLPFSPLTPVPSHNTTYVLHNNIVAYILPEPCTSAAAAAFRIRIPTQIPAGEILAIASLTTPSYTVWTVAQN